MDTSTLNHILFPKLSDAHIVQIEKLAQLKLYKNGEVISEVGDRDFCFFVIKLGRMAIVLERIAPGGQAGTSSKIENYLGFPTGISGRDLAASAVLQANKFGAQLAL